MEIVKVNNNNINLFSEVLVESAKWLNALGQPMWKLDEVSKEGLLKKYEIEEMNLCYDKGDLVGVYILQWYDPLFCSELRAKESGIIHKLSVRRNYRKMGYGRKIIENAEKICIDNDVSSLRLNCRTMRPKLRKFYEGIGFKKVDRVFIDNTDQIRYKKIISCT